MVDLVTLMALGVIWLYGWRVGYLWVRDCGVTESAALWSLSCIFPTAGLILAIHLPAVVSMISGHGWITPQIVALIFLAICWGTHRFIAQGREQIPLWGSGDPAGRHGQTCSPVSSDGVTGSQTSTSPQAGTRLGWWYLPVGIIAAMYAVFLLDALTGYPTGFDALHYHFPCAVHWMQQQQITLVKDVPHLCMSENGMMIPLLLSFAKLEWLFTVVHLPKALLLAVTIFALARSIGASTRASLVTACITLSIPMIVFQSFDGYVDLYAAASWLSALLALVWAMRVSRRHHQRNLLFLAGLSAGVALGARINYVVMIFILMLIVMSEGLIRSRCNRPFTLTPVRNVIVLGLVTLVCSGFWFVRGAIKTGNPLYPVEIKVAGVEILPGCYKLDEVYHDRSPSKRVSRWWDYPWREPKYSGSGYPYSRNNAFGAAFAAFIPPGLLMVTIGVFTCRSRDEKHRLRVVFVLIAACGIVSAPTVFKEVLRYALGPILVAMPLGAILLDRLMLRLPRCTLVTLTIALLATTAIATLRPAHSFLGRVRDGRWDRAYFYQMPPIVDELQPGSRIVNLGSADDYLGAPNRCYPLMGRNLSNVVITPVQWEVMLGGQPASAEALRKHAIDYIYVFEPWFDDFPGDLPVEKIYDNTDSRAVRTTSASRIYRVIDPTPADGVIVPRS